MLPPGISGHPLARFASLMLKKECCTESWELRVYSERLWVGDKASLAFNQSTSPGVLMPTTLADPTEASISYADTGGDGRPVILIHGWPPDRRSWVSTCSLSRQTVSE
jgi:hypothetical protein